MKALIDTTRQEIIDGVSCNPLVGLAEEEHPVHSAYQFFDFTAEAEDWSFWYRSTVDGTFIYHNPLSFSVPDEEPVDPSVEGQ